jgi:hypothetical protein
MPTRSYPVIPGTPGLVADIQALRPTPGTCIFIDVTGSTAMKTMKSRAEWIVLLSNFIGDTRAWLQDFPLLKTIGDELMYYIEDRDLEQKGMNHFQVYDALWKIATQQSHLYPDVKVSAAWCDDVYALTFIPGQQDYYGLGVDRTARLKGHVGNKQVIIDEALYRKVEADIHAEGGLHAHTSTQRLHGPNAVNLKGIPAPVTVYIGS